MTDAKWTADICPVRLGLKREPRPHEWIAGRCIHCFQPVVAKSGRLVREQLRLRTEEE
jgi:hypothetical protein